MTGRGEGAGSLPGWCAAETRADRLERAWARTKTTSGIVLFTQFLTYQHPDHSCHLVNEATPDAAYNIRTASGPPTNPAHYDQMKVPTLFNRFASLS